jgi:hypothetical protein
LEPEVKGEKNMAKTTDQIVLEIFDGKWGSGDERKKKLQAAGYNYDVIQKRINEVSVHMKSRKEAMKPWFDACKAQYNWSYNAKYNWGRWKKTIASSKDWGTCIAFPNTVAMRCGLIKEGYKIITSTGSNNDSKATQNSFYYNSVKAMNSINGKYWSSIKYPEKTTAQLVKEGKIKEGDIIGFMGHTASYAYKDNKGNLLFNHAGHAAGIYDNNKPGSNRAALNVKSSHMSNRKVYGVFSVNTFIVLTSCVGGSITYSDRYMAGQNATITIVPEAGKGVKSILVDGKAVGATTSYTINKIDSHHIIEVVCDTMKQKTIDELAHEVLEGKWGSGQTRVDRLKAAGYDATAVQNRVNELLNPTKTIEQLAQEVLDGKWGSGTVRKTNLTKAGYDYDAVQAKVNEILKINAEAAAAEQARLEVEAKAAEEAARLAAEEEARKKAEEEERLRREAEEARLAALAKIKEQGELLQSLGQEIVDGNWLLEKSETLNLEKPEYGYNAIQSQVDALLEAATNEKTSVNKAIANEKARLEAEEAKKKAEEEAKAKAEAEQKAKEELIARLAQEVLDGKWGSGKTRKEKLIAAGYDYDAVQAKVNELLENQAPVEKVGYSGILPTTTVVKSNAEVINDTIKWAVWIAGDNRFHYGIGQEAHHNGCYFCGTQPKVKINSKIKDPKFTYCCNPFVGAAWAHGGCVPKALSLCKKGSSWSFQAKNTSGYYYGSPLFSNLGHPVKSKLKKGDVLCKDTHVALYIGNGKIVEASGGDDNVRNSSKWNNSIRVTTLTDSRYKGFPRVHRFNSSVNATIIMTYGEVGSRVELWQKYLNWYFGKTVVTVDGIYGDTTLKYTKQFQEKEVGKGQGDGWVGPRTLAAAAIVKK